MGLCFFVGLSRTVSLHAALDLAFELRLIPLAMTGGDLTNRVPCQGIRTKVQGSDVSVKWLCWMIVPHFSRWLRGIRRGCGLGFDVDGCG